MDLEHELDVACRRAVGALDGAAVVRDGPANLQRGWEAAGGWLALSADWLAFTPHRGNWRVGRLLLCCRPFQGSNPAHFYRPPFGLHAYDDRFRQAAA